MPGVKVDLGTEPFGSSPDEFITNGLIGLPERLEEYKKQGAVFTKWRAVIRIDGDNTVWVDDREAPTRQEVLSVLRQVREGSPGSGARGPSSLLVLADGDAWHETVVMALDAGNIVGMENVRLASMEDEDL